MTRPRAFTLIELLIVVAIIAILAAIAVPNFLHAQLRAKIAKSVAEMKSISTALEAYRADNVEYPPFLTSGPDASYHFILNPLTSPVAYITSVPQDPFARASSEDFRLANGSYYRGDGIDTRDYLYTFRRPPGGSLNDPGYRAFHDLWGQWVLWGHGPDDCRQSGPDIVYEPSNGLQSWGDIVFSQKEGYQYTSPGTGNPGNVPYPRGRCGAGTPNP